MSRLLACVFAIMFAGLPASAQSGDPAGRWAIRSQGRPMVIVTLTQTASGAWSGSIERPTSLTTDATASSLTDVAGPRILRTISAAKTTANGLTFSVPSPRAGGGADTFSFEMRDDGTARMKPTGMPGDGFVLDRARADETMFAAWRADAEYPIDQHWATNKEMTQLFNEDQAARSGPGPIDWSKIAPEDVRRRRQAKALLDAGRLASADDFYHAAFVFQHGDKPEDFLMAHTLAMIAAARGKPSATWIASATLDRYLQSIGQPQIYGTQFKTGGPEATQEPYDRALVSDALRSVLGVPPLVEQEKTRQEYSRSR